MIFCGDTFLKTRDGADPLARVLEHFQDESLCINLETSLEAGKPNKKNVALSVPREALDGLPEQVRLVNIVNNHVGDGGDPRSLAEALRERGKTVIGPENPAMIRRCVEDVEVDFISAYFPLPRGISYGGTMARRLESLLCSSRAERRVVNLHWGYEHTDVPAPFQRALARRLVDAGADVIIGHHPHVPQGWETYRGATIFYSLGNFNFWQFDTETTEKNRWGYMVRYDPSSGDTEPIPYRVNENYQPVPALGREKAELLGRLQRLGEELKSMDGRTWFATHYRRWFRHELGVWKQRCRRAKSAGLFVKFIVWLLLPMQVRFYGHGIVERVRGAQHNRS